MMFLGFLALGESVWVVLTIHSVEKTVLLIKDAGTRYDVK
jgi:hypothetical protein